jgi:hypothetical protein
MSGQWYDVLAHYNGRKMIALSETGTLPNADLMELYGIDWSYFSVWSDDYLDDFTPAQIRALLNDQDILLLNELPLFPWSNVMPIAGDYNRNGRVDAADYVLWRKTRGQGGAGLAADGDQSGVVDAGDYVFWRTRFGRRAAGGGAVVDFAQVPEPNSLLLLVGIILTAIPMRVSRPASTAARRPSI